MDEKGRTIEPKHQENSTAQKRLGPEYGGYFRRDKGRSDVEGGRNGGECGLLRGWKRGGVWFKKNTFEANVYVRCTIVCMSF